MEKPSAEARQLNEAAGFPWPASSRSSHTQTAESETNMDSEPRVNKHRLAHWTRSKLAVGICSNFSPYPQWWRSLCAAELDFLFSAARQRRSFRKETRHTKLFVELVERKENKSSKCCLIHGKIVIYAKMLHWAEYWVLTFPGSSKFISHIHLVKSLERAKREG